jgi:hypothetical protein
MPQPRLSPQQGVATYRYDTDEQVAARRQFEQDQIDAAAANPRGRPGGYDTPLTPLEEVQFGVWKQQYAPNDSGEDYDLRGAFKAGFRPDEGGHWPDTFKKPNHPTFSNESQYAQYGAPGKWDQDRYVTPQEVSGGEMNRILQGQQRNAPPAQRPQPRLGVSLAQAFPDPERAPGPKTKVLGPFLKSRK